MSIRAFRGKRCPLLPWMQRRQPDQDSNNELIENDRAGISEEFEGFQRAVTMQRYSGPERVELSRVQSAHCAQSRMCERADPHPASLRVQEPACMKVCRCRTRPSLWFHPEVKVGVLSKLPRSQVSPKSSIISKVEVIAVTLGPDAQCEQ